MISVAHNSVYVFMYNFFSIHEPFLCRITANRSAACSSLTLSFSFQLFSDQRCGATRLLALTLVLLQLGGIILYRVMGFEGSRDSCCISFSVFISDPCRRWQWRKRGCRIIDGSEPKNVLSSIFQFVSDIVDRLKFWSVPNHKV